MKSLLKNPLIWFLGFLMLVSFVGYFTTTPDSIGQVVEQPVARETAPVAREKAQQDLMAIDKVPRTRKTKYDIEIVDIEPMGDDGVTVYVRAWDGTKQLGFGRRGDVDIERIKMHYLPTLVLDPNGDIEEVTLIDPDGATGTVRYRYDPREALLQDIEHTLSIKKEKFTDSRIVPGKVGNTTSTFNPEAEVPGTAGDGSFQLTNASWDTAHDTTSSAPNKSGASIYIFARYRTSDYSIYKSGYCFDTSAIGTDNISAATFSFYQTTDTQDNHTNTDRSVGIVEFTPANPANLAAGDIDAVGDALDNPTEGATRVTFATMISQGSNSYVDFPLNATGISWINKTGVTCLGARTSWDMDDTPPTPSNTTGSRVLHNHADAGANVPKLVVEHAAGGEPEATTTPQSVYNSGVYSGNTVIQ